MAEALQVCLPNLRQADAYAELLWQSFGLDLDFCERLVEQHLPDLVRVVVRGTRVVGGLLVDPQAQSWGGRNVPVVCIGGVAVDPVERRRGAATFLMTAILDEFRRAGSALAVLHASNHALYRKLGFEHAGVRQVVRFGPRAVLGDPRAAPVTRLGPDDRPAMQALYNDAVLPFRDGALQRSALRWDQALGLGSGGSVWWVGTRDDHGKLTGFVCWTTEGRAPTLTARVGELVATTPASADALRGVLAQLEATVQHIEVATAPSDPLWWGLAHPRVQTVSADAFLVRVLDPGTAVRWWGWGTGAGEARFVWHDPLFPTRDGPVVVSVQDGRGTLASAPAATVTLGPRGLAALLTGRVSAHQLHVLGLADVPVPRGWQGVFSSRSVYLRDMF